MENQDLNWANRETRQAWNQNADFWDERMGEGNDFVEMLIWSATEHLLQLQPGERVLDIACGNGLSSRRLAAHGAQVTAFDFAEEMIRHAQVRTTEHSQQIEYLVLDATDEAEEVLEGATSLDPRGAVDFRVITVIPPLLNGVSGMDGAAFAASWPLRDMEETIARETAKNVRERVAAFGIEPDKVKTRIGRPALEIKAYAGEIGADLVVLGSHGRHGVSGMILGSTANGVLHDCPCDVLTVRVGETEND